MAPKRQRETMRPEVAAAVEDILHGTSVNSHTEWLQREYLRLMRREAKWKQSEHESKLKTTTASSSSADNGNSVENRSTEQHGKEEHDVSADGNA